MIKRAIIKLYITIMVVLAIVYVSLTYYSVQQIKRDFTRTEDETVTSMTEKYYMPEYMDYEMPMQYFSYVVINSKEGEQKIYHYFDLNDSERQMITIFEADGSHTLTFPESEHGLTTTNYYQREEVPDMYMLMDPKGNCFASNVFNMDLDVEQKNRLSAAAESAVENGTEFGWCDDYHFYCQKKSNYSIVTFASCVGLRETAREEVITQEVSCAVQYAVIGILMGVCFLKFSKPFTERFIQQKQFITNASHDLKTPLTLIKTNLEILESENGHNGWISAMKKNTDSMTVKINALVKQSRMDEMALKFSGKKLKKRTAEMKEKPSKQGGAKS